MYLILLYSKINHDFFVNYSSFSIVKKFLTNFTQVCVLTIHLCLEIPFLGKFLILLFPLGTFIRCILELAAKDRS